MGCVTVKLNEEAQRHKQITMFSWCSKCKELSKSVTMQTDTYCLSFGKYLELRFHGHAYRCRDLRRDETDLSNTKPSNDFVCTHSLHRDHVQYFSYNGIVASFSYTPVEVWEISLPALKILLRIPRSMEAASLTDEIKSFSSRGYDIFVVIYDRLAQLLSDVECPLLNSMKKTLNNDQLAFREKVNAVHLLLAEPLVHAYEIDDAIFIMKKTLVDFIEIWTQRLADASVQYRNICAQQSNKSESSTSTTSSTASTSTITQQLQPIQSESQEGPSIDSGTICTEDFRSDPESPLDSSKSNVFLSREVSVDSDNSTIQKMNSTDSSNTTLSNQVTAERDTKSSVSSDKKSVKTILRELLPGEKPVQPLPSPVPSSENLSLTMGCVPVLVHDQDFSSVIAYSLASFDYKRKLDSLSYCETNRKSYDAATDTEDTLSSSISKESEKEKRTKTTQTHVEMSFQDSTTGTQFTCKVYFARDFDLLRSKLLNLAGSIDEHARMPFYRKHANSDSEGQSTKDFDRKSSNNSLNMSCDPLTLDEKCADTQKKDVDRVRAAFIRSLSKSIRWEARGGKSGSKFCKTLGKEARINGHFL